MPWAVCATTVLPQRTGPKAAGFRRFRPCTTAAQYEELPDSRGQKMMRTRSWLVVGVGVAVAAVTGCSGQKEAQTPAAPPAAAATTPPAAAPSAAAPAAPDGDAPIPDNGLAVRRPSGSRAARDGQAVHRRLRRDGQASRRFASAVTFNRTHYFIDKGQERGLTYESLKLFENDLNADLKTGNLKVHVVIVPMPRDQLYPALASGKVDMVAAMVTVTPEREKLVAFSEPTRTNVSEVVVTGPGAPPIATVDDLAGQEVFVRKGSIYDESLDQPERATEGARQAAGGDRRGPRRPRRR